MFSYPFLAQVAGGPALGWSPYYIGISIGLVAGLVLGALIIIAILNWMSRNVLHRAKDEALKIHENAILEGENRAKQVELHAKDKSMKAREAFEKSLEVEPNPEIRRKLEKLKP